MAQISLIGLPPYSAFVQQNVHSFLFFCRSGSEELNKFKRVSKRCLENWIAQSNVTQPYLGVLDFQYAATGLIVCAIQWVLGMQGTLHRVKCEGKVKKKKRNWSGNSMRQTAI